MSVFKHIKPEQLPLNLFNAIGNEWMLISAKDENTAKFNTMTASWGGAGVLWGRPFFVCYIRPQRFTYEFAEKTDLISLSFFEEEEGRIILNFCGNNSGRDCDKIAETGLKPVFDKEGFVYYEQAKYSLFGKKLYIHDLKPENFIDSAIPKIHYKAADYHRAYICEITDILERS